MKGVFKGQLSFSETLGPIFFFFLNAPSAEVSVGGGAICTHARSSTPLLKINPASADFPETVAFFKKAGARCCYEEAPSPAANGVLLRGLFAQLRLQTANISLPAGSNFCSSRAEVGLSESKGSLFVISRPSAQQSTS